MAVYKRGYQRYRGPLTGHWTRLLALPRFAWDRLLQQRLVVLLLVVSMVWPLLCAVFIYLANHSALWVGMSPDFAKILEVNGRFFIIFMNVQSVFALLLAALAGPGLIAPDLSNNALPLYFSRPLTRFDYVLAKLMVLIGLLSLVTWVPGLLLFVMQIASSENPWFGNNWSLGVGIFIGFLLWILIISLVALASSAYVKWRVVAGALVLGFFFITSGASTMIAAVFRLQEALVLNPAVAMYRVWCWLLGVEAPESLSASLSVITLVVLVAFLIMVLDRKLRPVEVIS